MKIVGVFNRCAFNSDKDAFLCEGPLHLKSVYQDEDGQHFYKYLDSGGVTSLIDKIIYLKNPSEKELELQRFLYGCGSEKTVFSENRIQYQYRPIQNQFYYKQIYLEHYDGIFRSCYADLSEFQEDKVIMEPNYVVGPQTRDSAALFPDRKLYIGSGPFIYNSNLEEFSIENKTVEQIEDIIRFLIDSMYLDEALQIIAKIRFSQINLDEFSYPESLILDGRPRNFLDDQVLRISAMKYVERRTNHLDLQFFKK